MNYWIIERVLQSSSTNEDLMKRARENKLIKPVARIAVKQLNGKGRSKKNWISHPNDSLTCSIAHSINKDINQLSGFSLVCSLAIWTAIAKSCCISIDELYQKQCRIKWPNDLIINHKKIGGILIEVNRAKNSVIWLIVGVGLNLFGVPKGLDILKTASLSEVIDIRQINRENLFLEIINQIRNIFFLFEQNSFQFFSKEWNRWHAYSKKPCEIIFNGQIQQRGIILYADQEGMLKIMTEDGNIQTISSSENYSLQLNL